MICLRGRRAYGALVDGRKGEVRSLRSWVQRTLTRRPWLEEELSIMGLGLSSRVTPIHSVAAAG
jgi:hypothetical protein